MNNKRCEPNRSFSNIATKIKGTPDMKTVAFKMGDSSSINFLAVFGRIKNVNEADVQFVVLWCPGQ